MDEPTVPLRSFLELHVEKARMEAELRIEKVRLEAELRVAQEKAVAEHRFKGIEDARFLAKQAQDAHDLHSNGLIQMLKEQAQLFPTRVELDSLKEQVTNLRLSGATNQPMMDILFKLAAGGALAYFGLKITGVVP